MKYNDKWAISEFEPKTDVLWVRPGQDEEDESIKINAFVNGKWRAITDKSNAYIKPQDGIPESDLSPAVKNTLDSADKSAQIVNNKDHKPVQFSGLGRVNFEKNIQTISGVDKNVLTQDMFYKGEVGSRVPNTNTIFLIQYDYDLNGQTITIPSDCVLKFDGGSLSNGTLVGINLEINSNINNIFDSSLQLELDNYKGEVKASWFGFTTSAIQKAIDSFPNSKINIDGVWEFDGTINVPYDVALICSKGNVNLPSGNATLFNIYSASAPVSLSDFVVNLDDNYTGTVINLYGVDSSHNNIRGWNATLEKNLASVDIEFPQIIGNTTSIGVVGINIAADELFYFKTFHAYAYGTDTHIRLSNLSGYSGLNSTEFHIDSFFCKTCLSVNGVNNRSTTFYIRYQAYSGSSKVLAIDNFDASTCEDAGVYHIKLWDASYKTNLIDNSNLATVLPYEESILNIVPFFTNNTVYFGDTALTNRSKSTIGCAEGIDINIRSVTLVNSYIGNVSTRVAAINNLVKNLRKLNITNDIGIDLVCGYFYYIGSVVYNHFALLVFESGETQTINFENKVELKMKFYISSVNGNTKGYYKRFLTEVCDYDNNIKLTKFSQLNYEGIEVTSITDHLILTSPITSKGVAQNKRPTLDVSAKGYMIFDTTHNCPIWWDGTAWVKADGTDPDA